MEYGRDLTAGGGGKIRTDKEGSAGPFAGVAADVDDDDERILRYGLVKGTDNVMDCRTLASQGGESIRDDVGRWKDSVGQRS